MYTSQTLLLIFAFISAAVTSTYGYSALQDARIIAQFRRDQELNHAKIARQLVHQANWASVGSISTNAIVENYPMVNIISVDDNDASGKSTGKIHFLLTDLDFTGPDWQRNNKVTFLFTDEQTLNCKNNNKDPMEPTCARIMISGQVRKISTSAADYKNALATFEKRHPAAINWMKAHHFYLCELDIQNIFVLDFYGGPHNVKSADYYSVQL
ncbi:protein CREG1 [Scaptodrosophila lebanonensis]|uniref:Protein CREG1 n=1 Tax=Drosophila lebanonensis TaxID=7225 RepID=A0A6J2T0T6_DROLE|nr:protein CREG1 [Scaptodrosophila lebanonensis]